MNEKEQEERERMESMIEQDRARRDREDDERVFARELSINILRGEDKIGENLIEVMGADLLPLGSP